MGAPPFLADFRLADFAGKGNVKLALYGMGWVRDERLNRLFTAKKVHFIKAEDKQVA